MHHSRSLRFSVHNQLSIHFQHIATDICTTGASISSPFADVVSASEQLTAEGRKVTSEPTPPTHSLGVSSAIVKQLNTDVNRVLQLADVRQKFESLGIEISNTTQEQFAQFIQDENTKWTKIVKASGAKVD